MLLRRSVILAVISSAALATPPASRAAPPVAPTATGADTVSSAVVDDRATPEDLPTRKAAAGPGRPDWANPLRTRPTAGGTAPPAAPRARPTAAAGESADASTAPATEAPEKPAGCGTSGCTSCARKVPVCKPKWEDKKTKRAAFTMKCEWECVRPWEPYCQGPCCEEKTTPCAGVYTKKRLYKTDEERCERVLKYDLEMKSAGECCDAAPVRDCQGCRILGETVHHLLSRCHH